MRPHHGGRIEVRKPLEQTHPYDGQNPWRGYKLGKLSQRLMRKFPPFDRAFQQCAHRRHARFDDLAVVEFREFREACALGYNEIRDLAAPRCKQSVHEHIDKPLKHGSNSGGLLRSAQGD